MQFTTLKSSSKGNCTLISSGNTHILVDIGCTLKYLKQALAEFSLTPVDINALLITHDHTDHICGLGTYARKFSTPVYASKEVWETLPKEIISVNQKNIFAGSLTIEKMVLDFFPLSHDAAATHGFAISDGRHKMVMATDTGFATPAMLLALKDADAIIIEANYSPGMLNYGPYPAFLKRRISGNRGHLSNIQAGECLKQGIGPKTQAVLLAHLSETNNDPLKALDEVALALKKREADSGFKFYVAPAHQPHLMITLK